MPIFAFVALLTIGNDISLTEPSNEVLKAAWRVGHSWKDDPLAFVTESKKTAAPRKQLESEAIVVEWRTPLVDAFRQGQKWTLEESKYDFKPLLKDSISLTKRLCFDVTVRALPDNGYRAPGEKKVEGLQDTSCSLLLGGRRLEPMGDPKFVGRWQSGSYTEGGLVWYNEVGKDLKGIYVEPKSEFRNYSTGFTYSEAKTRVEFDPSAVFDVPLDELVKSEFAIEVEVNGLRQRLKFTGKGREDFLKHVAKNVKQPTG